MNIIKLPANVLVVMILAAGFISGCSSIAFFPAEHAQKAADKVIDDIWPAADNSKISKEKELAASSTAPSMPAQSNQANGSSVK